MGKSFVDRLIRRRRHSDKDRRTLTLDQVWDKYPLPVTLNVVHGFMISEDECLSTGQWLAVHAQKKIRFAFAEDQRGRHLQIPTTLDVRVRVCDHAQVKRPLCFAKEMLQLSTTGFRHFLVLEDCDYGELSLLHGDLVSVVGVDKEMADYVRLRKQDGCSFRLQAECPVVCLPYSIDNVVTPTVTLEQALSLYKLPICVQFDTPPRNSTSNSNYGPNIGIITIHTAFDRDLVFATTKLADRLHSVTFTKSLPVEVEVQNHRLSSIMNLTSTRIVKPEHYVYALNAENPYCGSTFSCRPFDVSIGRRSLAFDRRSDAFCSTESPSRRTTITSVDTIPTHKSDDSGIMDETFVAEELTDNVNVNLVTKDDVEAKISQRRSRSVARSRSFNLSRRCVAQSEKRYAETANASSLTEGSVNFPGLWVSEPNLADGEEASLSDQIADSVWAIPTRLGSQSPSSSVACKSVAQVSLFLQKAGFVKAAALFRSKNMDGAALVKMTQSDLLLFGFSRFESTKLLMTLRGWRCLSLEDRPFHPRARCPAMWSVQDVCAHCRAQNLDDFADFCARNQVDGSLLTRLSPETLVEVGLSEVDTQGLLHYLEDMWDPNDLSINPQSFQILSTEISDL